MASGSTPEFKKAVKSKANHSPDPEWYMKSYFPVSFPAHPAFTLSTAQFDEFLRKELVGDTKAPANATAASEDNETIANTADTSVVETNASTTADLRGAMNDVKLERPDTEDSDKEIKPELPFMKGLAEHDKPPQPDMSNKMLTENGDIAFRSTKSSLVDLFHELEDVVSGPRLYQLLEDAWKHDPLITLKIIFNARSIHLGKSSRPTTYRCFGWLAKQHPLTLVKNLQWLSRPVIEKKVEKKVEGEDDIVMVEEAKDDNDNTRFDVKNGVAHGYWKDLLNILALSSNKKLDVLSNPKDVLNVKRPMSMKKKDVDFDQDRAKVRRRDTRDNRHSEAVAAFNEDPVHRALHLTIARLFAEQLRADLALMQKDKKGARHISLCAKWAPSQKLFHDKHTFVVSSIAEIMHPQSEFPGVTDRDNYLRRAREAYRKDVAFLRKVLEVVERDITAQTFEKIRYDRIPSIAMNNYAGMFATKDTERFEKYIEKVADGKKQISGATLLPSKLIAQVRESSGWSSGYGGSSHGVKRNAKGVAKNMIESKMQQIGAKVIDGQWKALVKRIKDSGTLESSIAVCDVSGSMQNPTFLDGTTPLDSSIGLSLLVAEVTKPPFGGSFITFSDNPEVQQIYPNRTLKENYEELHRASWDMSTNFVAVFEDLILPMATRNKLTQDDMVKQIFVFSDMQFDSANSGHEQWDTSYKRIEEKYKLHGYEMPKLIFWNLAGGRAGYGGGYERGDPIAPKPVEHDQNGTALVSGYSQGMLKVFLDNGSFQELEEDVEVDIVEKDDQAEGDENGDKENDVVEVKKKRKMDPLSTVKKAISHKAYSMLEVFD